MFCEKCGIQLPGERSSKWDDDLREAKKKALEIMNKKVAPMTNAEAINLLQEHVKKQGKGLFSWPLDSDYAQHCRYVDYRNKYLTEGGLLAGKDYQEFVLDYIEILKGEACPI